MERIYIIEDDENIMNLLKIALEGFGYAAEGFETAEEGLARMREEKPDLVIFDWMLPGMDGTEAIKEVRNTEQLKYVPIMLLTAKEKELDKVVGLDCGADDYMVKPFGVLELSARIRSQTGGGQGCAVLPGHPGQPQDQGGVKRRPAGRAYTEGI